MRTILKTYWLVISLNLTILTFLVIYLDISVIKKVGMSVAGLALLLIGLARSLSDKKGRKTFLILEQQVIIYGIIKTIKLRKDAIVCLEVKKTLLSCIFHVYRLRIGTVMGNIIVYTNNNDFSGLTAELPRTSVASN